MYRQEGQIDGKTRYFDFEIKLVLIEFNLKIQFFLFYFLNESAEILDLSNMC
jgi:hypothetical protein